MGGCPVCGDQAGHQGDQEHLAGQRLQDDDGPAAVLDGLPLVYGVAMGIGAMTTVMLRLPLTAVLLATLLLGHDGLTVMPVAVVVAYVGSARLAPASDTASGH